MSDILLARPSTIRTAIEANTRERDDIQRRLDNPVVGTSLTELRKDLYNLEQSHIVLINKLHISLLEHEKCRLHRTRSGRVIKLETEDGNTFRKQHFLVLEGDTIVLDNATIAWLLIELATL